VREIKTTVDLSKKITAELSLLEVAVIYATFAKETMGNVREKVLNKLGSEIAEHIGTSNGRKDVGWDLYSGAQTILMNHGLLEGRD
jgi:riboflavin synthase